MKILFIINSLAIGGAERQVVELIKGLSKKGYHCELILLKNTILYPEVHSTGCKLHILDKKKYSTLQQYREIYRIIKRLQPDIIQAGDVKGAAHIFLFAFLFKIPFINYCIRYAKTVPMYSKLDVITRIIFAFSDIVIANSKAGLKAHRLSCSDKYRYIYNGYDLSRSVTSLTSEQMKNKMNITDKVIVGMVARFSDEKDYETFIKAGQQLISMGKNVVFVMMGNGYKLNEMKQLVISLGNRERFIFIENVTSVEKYMSVFDIYCLTCNTNGYAEGISNSIIEAMAMKKVVIATDSGGNGEIVLGGETGYIIPPFNITDLVEKISVLIENPKMRYEMGFKGRRRIENVFSLDKLVENFINLYDEMLHERHKGIAM